MYEAQVKKGDEILGVVVDANGKLMEKHPEKHEKK